MIRVDCKCDICGNDCGDYTYTNVNGDVTIKPFTILDYDICLECFNGIKSKVIVLIEGIKKDYIRPERRHNPSTQTNLPLSSGETKVKGVTNNDTAQAGCIGLIPQR